MATRASVVVTATPATFTPPFVNALTLNSASTLTVTVTNTGTETVRTLDFRMGTAFYTAVGGVAPSAGGFVASLVAAGGDGATYGVIRFRAGAGCTSGDGLPPNASLDFVINFITPADDTRSVDYWSSAFRVTATTYRTDTTRCNSTATSQPTYNARIKVLAITASGPQSLAGPGVGSVSWTVTNLSNQSHTNVTVGTPLMSPSSGATLAGCTTIASLASGANDTITCTYNFTSTGIYTFAAAASDDAGTSTSVAASAGPVTVGTFSTTSVTFSKAVVVAGRSPQSISITVHNGTGQPITGIDVSMAAGWTLMPGAAGGSVVPSGGLTYSAGSSIATRVVFNGGTLANGANAVLTINFSAVPAAGQYPFTVALTYPGGPESFPDNNVTVVQPVSDPVSLNMLATRVSHILTWGPPAQGSLPAGVVVFRTPAPTVPPAPTDFTVYAEGRDGVVRIGDSSVRSATLNDAGSASFNYRVCNRDANYVYSDCDNGFWNNAGWLDSGVPPASGWVHVVSGGALHRPGFLTGDQFGLASDGPYVNVLDISSGMASFLPVKLTALPPAYTPAFKLTDASYGNTGAQVLFAGDSSGQLSKIDLASGTNLWASLPRTSTGAFTAGLSGITAWSAGPPSQYRTIYGTRDILLIGTSNSTGTVYAVDCATGATLWSFDAGAPVNGLITFDAATDVFWVPTAGQGVKAYSIRDTTPSSGPSTTLAGWTNPNTTGTFLTCVRTAGGAYIACVSSTGALYVMDKTKGATTNPTRTFSSINTINNPTSLVRISGSGGTVGLLVSNGTSARVILQSAATPPALSRRATWTPGYTISAPSVLGDTGFGFFAVGGSDGSIHLVDLTSSTTTELTKSAAVSTQLGAGTLLLGQPIYDTTTGLFVFGTNDGHVWALTYPGSFQ